MKKILFFTMLTVLAACSVSHNAGVMTAEKRTGGFMGLSENDAVEVSTGEAFAGQKEVIIGGFKVGFNESKSMSNKASGGLLGEASEVALQVTLNWKVLATQRDSLSPMRHIRSLSLR